MEKGGWRLKSDPTMHSPCSSSSCAMGLGLAPCSGCCDLLDMVATPFRFDAFAPLEMEMERAEGQI